MCVWGWGREGGAEGTESTFNAKGWGDIINYDITGIKNSLRNKLDTTYKGEIYTFINR